MKTHTSSFKEQIKLIGKEIDSRITFGSTVLGKNDLNAVTPSYQGAILKSVMKQLDIDSNVAIPIGTILKYEFGLKVNGEYEYINYGNYIVYSVEKQEDTKSYKITCYDKLLYSMLDYVKLPITYPISIRDYINAISTVLGLKFANKSETFANYNKQIQADLYDGLGYTFRDVLDELAQVTASTICLNNNDELEIRYITETGDTIDEEYLKDVNVNFGEKFGAVNTIVLSRSGDSDSVYYPSTLPTNPYEIKISDNQIMNGNDRADFLPDIYNKLNGLEFYTNDFVSTGICYYDLCDRYSVKVGDNTYSCVMFNDEILVTQGLEENVYTELPEQTETDYKHASKDDRMINQVYIIAKKNEAEILALVSTTETIQKEINPIKVESGSEITIEDASNNPLTYLEIEGKSTQETRSGKNLMNASLDETIVNGLTMSADLGKLYLNGTATAEDRYLFGSTTLPSGTYTMCLQLKSGTTPAMGFYPYIGTSWVHLGGAMLNSGNEFKNSVTFTIDVETVITLGAYIGNNNTFDNAVINYQIVSGSIADYDFEEYGASPSPEYPSEIKSVGYENLWSLDSSYTTETGSEYVLRDAPIPTIPAGTYILSLKKSANVNVLFYFKDSLNNGTEIFLNGVEEQMITFSSDITIAVIYIYGTSSCTISDIQITKGTKQHSYIPYGKYGIEVETVGKNLLNCINPKDVNYATPTIEKNILSISSSATNTTPYVAYEFDDVKLNDIFTVSSILLDTNCQLLFQIYINNNWATLSSSILKYIDGKSFSKYSYKIIEGVTKIRCLIYSSGVIPTGSTIARYQDIMITKNNEDTTYQPYQKNISVMVLNEPLRSLPNGVKDVAYVRNNKLYVDRYVGSVVLDGSENWEISGTNYYIRIEDKRDNFVSTPNALLCSNFRVQELMGNADNIGYISESYWTTGNKNILLNYDNGVGGVSSFKTWLSTHNTQVDYELATPVTEELGEIEMLKTLKGYNNISTTDELLPIINLTYVRDTIIADYVENHVAELKLTENEIKASVESVSSSVDGLNTTINRVEEITNDNSQVINIISTNIDRTTGEVREVTTTNGFKFDSKGLNIYTDENSYNTQIDNVGTYYKDGNEVISQTTKDGSLLKNLKMQGQTQYSFDGDSYGFIEERVEIDGEYCYATFYNGEE